VFLSDYGTSVLRLEQSSIRLATPGKCDGYDRTFFADHIFGCASRYREEALFLIHVPWMNDVAQQVSRERSAPHRHIRLPATERRVGAEHLLEGEHEETRGMTEAGSAIAVRGLVLFDRVGCYKQDARSL
jgi:hypothetical protein